MARYRQQPGASTPGASTPGTIGPAAQAMDRLIGTVGTLASSVSRNLVPSLAKAATGITSMFSQIASGFGIANNAIVRLAASASPAQAVQLDLAFRALHRTLGLLLQPVLEASIKFVRGLADTFANLGPGAKALVVALGGVAVVLGALVPVILAVTAAFVALDFVSGGILVVIGALVTAFAAVGAGIGYFATASEKLRSAVEPLKGLFDDLLTILEDVAGSGLEALAEVMGMAAAGFREFWRIIAPLRDELVKLGRALGPLVAELVRLGVKFAELYVAANTLIPSLEAVVFILASMVEQTTRLIVLMTILSEKFRIGPLNLAGLAGTFDDVEKRMKALDERRDRSKRAVGGATGVRFTSAEEFGRSQTAAALLASFATPKAQTPAEQTARSTTQTRDEVANLRRDVAHTNETLGQVLGLLGPLGPYIRKVAGQ